MCFDFVSFSVPSTTRLIRFHLQITEQKSSSNVFLGKWEILCYPNTIRLCRSGEENQLAGMRKWESHEPTDVNKQRLLQFQNVLNELTWNDQKSLLEQTVQWPILEKYPLQVKYVIRFLRHIIDALESRNEEIHDDLYTIFCDYQAKATQLDNGVYSYKHYRIVADRESELITLKENHNKISQGTTGLNVWEAALALCEWSIGNKSALSGKNVLELGAGTGLSGLVIGKCCRPNSIVLTDGDDNVLNYLRENVRNNFQRNDEGQYSNGCTSVGRRDRTHSLPVPHSLIDFIVVRRCAKTRLVRRITREKWSIVATNLCAWFHHCGRCNLR